MCGRYTFRATPKKLEAEPQPWQDLWVNVKVTTPRYNIAPTQLAPIVTNKGIKEFAFGVQPDWSKSSLINAKSENLMSSRYWNPKAAMFPCLIPCDGFYEPKGEAGTKRPWYAFELDDSEPFFMAGMFTDQNFVIITKEPNSVVKDIHSRMPVVLDSSQVETCKLWLDTTKPLKERVNALMEPIEYAYLSSFPVGDAVKNPRSEGKGLFERVEGELNF